MDGYNFVLEAISSVGFPVVACCFMAWFCYQMQETIKELTVAIRELTVKFDDHVEEVASHE